MFNFRKTLKEKYHFVDRTIQDLKLSKVHSLLAVPTMYAITAGGKRLRPIICMLCNDVVGGDAKETRDAFLALELIHNGTLVHDDIIDEDLFRRGKLSVQVKFGLKQAVLTGDALLGLGLQYAAKTGNLRIVEWLSETVLKMWQGVALQTFYRRKRVSEATYLNINYLKCGSLFEAAAAIGGFIGSDRIEDTMRLADFGRNFGNAYQIRDDICGMYAENRNDALSRNDILNGDLSLLFIYALDSDSITDRDGKMLMAIYKGETKRVKIEEVQRIYKETSALDRSIEKMKYFAEMGRECLKKFKRNEAIDCLNYLIDRYYRLFSPGKKLEDIF